MLFGRSRDARVWASRGFSSPSARFVPAGGGEEPLVARSVRASSLLSPRFICELGILELLSFSKLQLFYVRLALSPHLCTFDEVMGWESDSECRLGYVLDYLSRLISARSARW